MNEGARTMAPPEWLEVTASRVEDNALVLEARINWDAPGVADWLASELIDRYPDVAPSVVRAEVQTFVRSQRTAQE